MVCQVAVKGDVTGGKAHLDAHLSPDAPAPRSCTTGRSGVGYADHIETGGSVRDRDRRNACSSLVQFSMVHSSVVPLGPLIAGAVPMWYGLTPLPVFLFHDVEIGPILLPGGGIRRTQPRYFLSVAPRGRCKVAWLTCAATRAGPRPQPPGARPRLTRGVAAAPDRRSRYPLRASRGTPGRRTGRRPHQDLNSAGRVLTAI